MIPRPAGFLRLRPSLVRSAVVALGAVLSLVALVAGCAGTPAATFDPDGPCVADGAAPGAYPELEARLPSSVDGTPPTTVDSGRNCTPKNLGSLGTHDLTEVRFAGAVWDRGGGSGVTTAIFTAPGLRADWIAEFYETSAEAGRRTEDIVTTTPTVAGRPGHRMDLRNGESLQSVVVWPSTTPDTVNVVLSADIDESIVQAAIAALEGANG